jgi:hypothetical protein
MTKEDPTKLGRRELLRVLGVGAGAAAAGVAMPAGARADNETDGEKKKVRYRETEHVKAFYRVNKYPTKS